MLIQLKSSSLVLVAISSIPVLICNRFNESSYTVTISLAYGTSLQDLCLSVTHVLLLNGTSKGVSDGTAQQGDNEFL